VQVRGGLPLVSSVAETVCSQEVQSTQLGVVGVSRVFSAYAVDRIPCTVYLFTIPNTPGVKPVGLFSVDPSAEAEM
jgi:hypothetical protein